VLGCRPLLSGSTVESLFDVADPVFEIKPRGLSALVSSSEIDSSNKEVYAALMTLIGKMQNCESSESTFIGFGKADITGNRNLL
jgi:hypothetical protein